MTIQEASPHLSACFIPLAFCLSSQPPQSFMFSRWQHSCEQNAWLGKKKVKLWAVEAHRVMRLRGSHIVETIGSQMAVRLLALRANRPPFTPRKIPGTHFC
jgi:hypothetical protein